MVRTYSVAARAKAFQRNTNSSSAALAESATNNRPRRARRIPFSQAGQIPTAKLVDFRLRLGEFKKLMAPHSSATPPSWL